MKIVICDDKYADTKVVKELIVGYKSIVSDDVVITSPVELDEELDKKTFDYDIAIMDIEFTGLQFNGIDLGRKINKMAPDCQIIYLTHIIEYASDVYETGHVYFVLKQNKDVTLFRALDKAIQLVSDNKNKKFLEVVSDGKKNIVLQKDIYYFERQQRVVKIYMENETYDTYISLSKYMSDLADDFARCHGGFIVNMNYVSQVESDVLRMKGGLVVPLGRTYKDAFMQRYMDFLSLRV